MSYANVISLDSRRRTVRAAPPPPPPRPARTSPPLAAFLVFLPAMLLLGLGGALVERRARPAEAPASPRAASFARAASFDRALRELRETCALPEAAGGPLGASCAHLFGCGVSRR